MKSGLNVMFSIFLVILFIVNFPRSLQSYSKFKPESFLSSHQKNSKLYWYLEKKYSVFCDIFLSQCQEKGKCSSTHNCLETFAFIKYLLCRFLKLDLIHRKKEVVFSACFLQSVDVNAKSLTHQNHKRKSEKNRDCPVKDLNRDNR